MRDDEDREVLYWVRRSANPHGAIGLVYLYRFPDDAKDIYRSVGRYFPYTQEQVDSLESQGQIKEVPGHPVIDPTIGLFLANNGDVFFSYCKDPYALREDGKVIIANDFIKPIVP